MTISWLVECAGHHAGTGTKTVGVGVVLADLANGSPNETRRVRRQRSMVHSYATYSPARNTLICRSWCVLGWPPQNGWLVLLPAG